MAWVAIVALLLLAGVGALDRAGAARPGGTGATGALAAAPSAGAIGLLYGHPLDLNRASAETLEVLPGIGPGRAAAIVAYRREQPFLRVADLERVDGIGPRTVARLEGWVAVRRARDGGDR